jgi:hypothetical protein
MRASGCSGAAKNNPHEMGSEKGNVKIGRKIGCPQILEKDWLAALDDFRKWLIHAAL